MCDLETSRIGAPYIYIYIYIYDISRLRVNVREHDSNIAIFTFAGQVISGRSELDSSKFSVTNSNYKFW